jgi:bifunctional DNA-binding transcriptional regulator/antitoxin component of YhaV-PrlF toxin-antitoxin module
MNETTVKGTTTIPLSIRRRLGIGAGTHLYWSTRGGVIEARRRPVSRTALQRHIRARAGTWDGTLSAEQLLKKTRP